MSAQDDGGDADDRRCRCATETSQEPKRTSVIGIAFGCVIVALILYAMRDWSQSEVDLQARTRAVSFTSVQATSIALPGCSSIVPCPSFVGATLPESPEFALRLKPGVRVEVETVGRRVTIRPVPPADPQAPGAGAIAGALDRRSGAFDAVLKETVYRPVATDVAFGQPLVLPDVGKLVSKNDFLTITLPARVRVEVGAPTRDRSNSSSPMLIEGKAQFSARTKVWLLPADPAFLIQEQALYAGDLAILDTSGGATRSQPVSGLIRIDMDGVMNVRARGVAPTIVYEPFGGGLAGPTTLISQSLMGVVLAHPLAKMLVAVLAVLSALWGIPKLFGTGGK